MTDWRPFSEEQTRLDEIPGIGRAVAAQILAEIGTDMTSFPTAGHLATKGHTPPKAQLQSTVYLSLEQAANTPAHCISPSDRVSGFRSEVRAISVREAPAVTLAHAAVTVHNFTPRVPRPRRSTELALAPPWRAE